MTTITVHVKTIANNKEILQSPDFNKNSIEGINLRIDLEKQEEGPIISGASLSGDHYNALLALLSADAVVRIVIEKYIGDLAELAIKATFKSLSKLITSNNSQKRNYWGTKVEFHRNLSDGRIQTISFFLDQISEDKIEDALSKIQEKFKTIGSFLGETFLEKIKNIGFKYDEEMTEWQILAIEQFDGEVFDKLP